VRLASNGVPETWASEQSGATGVLVYRAEDAEIAQLPRIRRTVGIGCGPGRDFRKSPPMQSPELLLRYWLP
jgi:hypothetical protein